MIGPIALTVLALAALLLSRNYEIWLMAGPGPGLLPAIGALILLVASLASFRRAPSAESISPHFPRVAGYIAGLLAIPPSVMVLGMLPTLAVFIAVILRFFEDVRTLPTLIITVASVLGTWILFEKLLAVTLPKPFFW